MKTKTSIGMLLLSATLGIGLVGGYYAMNANAQEEGEAASTNSVAVPETNAPPVETVLESTLPADVNPDSAFAQLVRMVQAGVDTDVMLAYIAQSPRFFELDADDIIYLTDIGTPPEVIQAAMERDQQLIAEGIGIQNRAPEAPAETVEATNEEPPVVTVNEFYDDLAPYGTWVYVEGYGRCWRPTVVIHNSGWQPYCDNGRWVYTDCGWYWMSNYSWGWAAFHYGRWFHNDRYGWCWWPDTVWAPSWVHWRYNSSYCGWAPLPPYTIYRPGVGLVYRGSVVSVGFSFNLSRNHYTFVSTRNFCDPHLRRHRLPRHDVERIYSTTEGNHWVDVDQRRRIVNRGIPVDRISTASQREIKPVSIRYGTNHADRRSSFETLDRTRRTVVVNRPDRVRRNNTASRSTSEPRSNISRSSSSREGGQPAVNPTQTHTAPPPKRTRPTPPSNSSTPDSVSPPQRTTPTPNRTQPATPRNSSNPGSVTTPQQNTPPSTRSGNSAQRPSTSRPTRPARPAPSARPSTTPRQNNNGNNQGTQRQAQQGQSSASTPSAGTSSKPSRAQPNTSRKPSQVGSSGNSNRSNNKPKVNRKRPSPPKPAAPSRSKKTKKTDSDQ